MLISYGPILAVLPLRLRFLGQTNAILSDPEPPIQRVFRLPWQAFMADLSAWLVAGLVMVLIYYVFPPSGGLSANSKGAKRFPCHRETC